MIDIRTITEGTFLLVQLAPTHIYRCELATTHEELTKPFFALAKDNGSCGCLGVQALFAGAGMELAYIAIDPDDSMWAGEILEILEKRPEEENDGQSS